MQVSFVNEAPVVKDIVSVTKFVQDIAKYVQSQKEIKSLLKIRNHLLKQLKEQFCRNQSVPIQQLH
jgi:hypothetical protein